MLGSLALIKVLCLMQATQQPSVAGTIRDGINGKPLADVVVVLADLDRSVVSDAAGHYTFLDVPPGPQHLTIQRIGYAPRTLHALVPAQGRLQIDIGLYPMPMKLPGLVARSKVSVRGLESVDTTPYPERGVTMAAVRNDPLLAEPDGLLGLGGGEVAATPESPSGIHLRGGASDQTGYLLDGIPVFSPYHAGGTFSAWNPDALERVEVASATPSLAFPDALSGTISAVTRSPGPVTRFQGAVSTVQARLAAGGPLGRSAGYTLSFRTGFPAAMAPRHDPSYLGGNTQDLLAEFEAGLLRGKLGLLIYDTRNTINSALTVDTSGPIPVSNGFEWGSRSIGAHWTRSLGDKTLRLQAWNASSDAEATWLGGSSLSLSALRRDDGLLAMIEWGGVRSSNTAGVRFERSRTGYRVAPVNGGEPGLDLQARTPLAAAFFEHQRAMGPELRAIAGASVLTAGGGIHLNLQSRLHWQVSDPLALTASYARTHQFAQSLRNSESVVGNVFPANLYIGVGAPGVPVARNDRAVLAADYHPTASLRLGAQAYWSNYAGLLLVAPGTGQPFATDGFTTGEGTAPGFSFDAALSGMHYGLVARYAWEQVRLEHADSSYTPAYATGQVLELGAIVFPSATSSIRLGLTRGAGRQATEVSGSFEWEACNLLDRGCEFGGIPQASGRLGALRLPAYLRLDLSARKHWHLMLGRRDVTFAVFGTLTNLLGRTNILTVATDPVTGRSTPVEMRPRAPLVIGVDWRF